MKVALELKPIRSRLDWRLLPSKRDVSLLCCNNGAKNQRKATAMCAATWIMTNRYLLKMLISKFTAAFEILLPLCDIWEQQGSNFKDSRERTGLQRLQNVLEH
jgi:hypothetical protein